MKGRFYHKLDSMVLPTGLKKILRSVLHFAYSPYYGWRMAVIWPLFLGGIYTLFPFENISIRYIMRPAVLETIIESYLLLSIIISWIMFLCYRLDRQFGGYRRWGRRLVLQICLGGIIPLVLLLTYLRLVYGKDMMESEYMHFVYALYLLLLLVLNRHGYIVYIEQKNWRAYKKIEYLRQQLTMAHNNIVLMDKDVKVIKEQNHLYQKENKELKVQLGKSMDRVLDLTAELTHKETLLAHANHEVVIPELYNFVMSNGEIRYFEQKDIRYFYIIDSFHKKPVITLVLNSGEEFLIPESSLTSLAFRLTEMIHVNRKFLIGAHTLLGMTKTKDGSVLLEVVFQEEEITVSANRFRKIEGKIARALASRN